MLEAVHGVLGNTAISPAYPTRTSRNHTDVFARRPRHQRTGARPHQATGQQTRPLPPAGRAPRIPRRAVTGRRPPSGAGSDGLRFWRRFAGPAWCDLLRLPWRRDEHLDASARGESTTGPTAGFGARSSSEAAVSATVIRPAEIPASPLARRSSSARCSAVRFRKLQKLGGRVTARVDRSSLLHACCAGLGCEGAGRRQCRTPGRNGAAPVCLPPARRHQATASRDCFGVGTA